VRVESERPEETEPLAGLEQLLRRMKLVQVEWRSWCFGYERWTRRRWRRRPVNRNCKLQRNWFVQFVQFLLHWRWWAGREQSRQPGNRRSNGTRAIGQLRH